MLLNQSRRNIYFIILIVSFVENISFDIGSFRDDVVVFFYFHLCQGNCLAYRERAISHGKIQIKLINSLTSNYSIASI